MKADEVVIMALGASKAHAVAMCVEEGVNHSFPASILQLHRQTVFVVDNEATLDLRVKTVRYFKGLSVRENELAKRQENALKRFGPAKL